MALSKIQAAGLTADLIDETKLADDSIDSEHYNDGSIDEAHIADDAVTADKLANSINTEIAANTAKVSLTDNSVTLAKMAGGTDGQIITYDASGDPIAVGPGTDGQVLTSTGAGSPPAFETLPTSGATLSGSTNNTVVTVTGANAMIGEANLTFDGSNLGLGTSSPGSWNTDADDFVINSAGSAGITISTGSAGSTQEGNIFFAEGTAGSGDKFRGGIRYEHGADKLRFYTDNTQRLEVGEHTTVKDGNLVIGTAGHGIDFAAQTPTPASGASATQEVLDHYEEGTWTPEFRGYHGGNGAWQGWVYATNPTTATGTYTRVGNVVTVWFKMEGFASVNPAQMSYPSIMGLPFSETSYQQRGVGTATSCNCFSNSAQTNGYVAGPVDGFNWHCLVLSTTGDNNPDMSTSSGRSFKGGIVYSTGTA